MSIPPAELEAAKTKVFTLIGRNVLRYQQLETLLKALVSLCDIKLEGINPTDWTLPDPKSDKSTMGTITKVFFEKVVTAEQKEEPPKETKPDVFQFRFQMHLPVGAEAHVAWMNRMQRLITARNDLIHHSLNHLQLESVEECRTTCVELEARGAEVAKEVQLLKNLIKSWSEMKSEALHRFKTEP